MGLVEEKFLSHSKSEAVNVLKALMSSSPPPAPPIIIEPPRPVSPKGTILGEVLPRNISSARYRSLRQQVQLQQKTLFPV
jgi:hypothetical protein